MSKQAEAHEIVKRHSLWSVGAGLVPVPALDLAAVSGVQLRMLNQLSRLYEKPFKENAGKSVIGSLLGSLVPSGLAGHRLLSFLHSVPVVGTVSFPAFAGASTLAIGKVFVAHFESGGDLLNLNLKKAKEEASEALEEGNGQEEEAEAPKAKKGAKK